jgi:hypothetical protein
MTISGTAVTFGLMTRFTPALIAWCTARLGMERQSTRNQDICLLQEPTLFRPSQHVFGVHGPFGKWARKWSAHLVLERLLTTAAALRSASRPRACPPTAPSPSTRAQAELNRELEGSAVRSSDP